MTVAIFEMEEDKSLWRYFCPFSATKRNYLRLSTYKENGFIQLIVLEADIPTSGGHNNLTSYRCPLDCVTT